MKYVWVCTASKKNAQAPLRQNPNCAMHRQGNVLVCFYEQTKCVHCKKCEVKVTEG